MSTMQRLLLLLLLGPFSTLALPRSGPPKDLSPEPARTNATYPAPGETGGGGGAETKPSWYNPPSLNVLYDEAIQLASSEQTFQLYSLHVHNNGPGGVCQLAVLVQDWNTSVEWWGIDTLPENETYQYMPLYRSDVWTGEDWDFGFVQNRTDEQWPRVDPVYGQTCDGRWFNATAIISAPSNPPGTNATLTMREGYSFDLGGERYVLYAGNVKNTGNYSIVGVGIYVPSIFDTVATWHVAIDPATNATYLPLTRHQGLQPNESTDFGVVTKAGQASNFSLTYVTTRNQLWALTAANNFFRGPNENLGMPPGTGTETVVDTARGGRSVAFPPLPQTTAANSNNTTATSQAMPSNTTTTTTTTTETTPSSNDTTSTGSNATTSSTDQTSGTTPTVRRRIRST